jgi:hypothetical protein
MAEAANDEDHPVHLALDLESATHLGPPLETCTRPAAPAARRCRWVRTTRLHARSHLATSPLGEVQAVIAHQVPGVVRAIRKGYVVAHAWLRAQNGEWPSSGKETPISCVRSGSCWNARARRRPSLPSVTTSYQSLTSDVGKAALDGGASPR